ncbi:MAG: HD domain-containing phosphohydrolase [Planctomycetota bacterium]
MKTVADMTDDPLAGDADSESFDSIQAIQRRLEDSEAIEQLSAALTLKFEELSLIHNLTESLRLDHDAETSCRPLVDQLMHCISAQYILIELDDDTEVDFDRRLVYKAGPEVPRIADPDEAFAEHLADARQRLASQDQPPLPSLRNAANADGRHAYRMVAISLQRSGRTLGRMIAVRDLGAREFGTVEADLMQSTGMFLAAHLVNQRQFHQMQMMFDGMIKSLVSALDAKDAYTCGHSSRVADLSVELAKRLGYDEDGLKRIHRAGLLHDVGKIGVEDAVLRKPGRLTHDEFEQIKRHPVFGYEILRDVRPFQNILPAVRHHHESVDGSGYPDGLAGNRIPRDAQVLAVADAFDAMTSDRPYRTGMPIEKVIEIFKRGRGQQWAADVVDVLLDNPQVMSQYSLRQSPADGSPSHSAGR